MTSTWHAHVADARDVDPQETQEWLDALAAVIRHDGPDRARQLLETVVGEARAGGVPVHVPLSTPYVNSIPPDAEERIPGDAEAERRLRSLVRWNAIAMVLRANRGDASLGGHIASYQSAATLYEVGFNHFWRAPPDRHGGDLVYIQGHSSPGIYARAFLEGSWTDSGARPTARDCRRTRIPG